MVMLLLLLLAGAMFFSKSTCAVAILRRLMVPTDFDGVGIIFLADGEQKRTARGFNIFPGLLQKMLDF